MCASQSDVSTHRRSSGCWPHTSPTATTRNAGLDEPGLSRPTGRSVRRLSEVASWPRGGPLASVIGPVGMVIVVTAAGTVFVERPVLAAVTEALSDVGGTDFTIAGSGAVLEVSSQRPVLSPQFEPRAEAALSAVLRDVAADPAGCAFRCRGRRAVPRPMGCSRSCGSCASSFGEAFVLRRAAAPIPARLPTCGRRRQVDRTDGARRRRTSLTGSADRSLRKLIAIGALEAREGRLRRSAGMVTLGRLWAIEAKVEEWQSGLAQVHRYRLWADGAVLVLGRARVPVEAIAADARHYRVGLVIEGRWVARPRVALPDDATRLYASEHMLAALIGAATGSRS